MIALPKLLLIILFAAAAWYAVRWINRLPEPTMRRRAAVGPGPQPAIEAEDLVACRVCGAYVTATAGSCGKAGCPRPR